jgi:hypothetical protein
MPVSSVKLIPGVNVEKTPTLNEAGYSFSQLIRWQDKLVQKLGGWTRFYPFALGGICKAMWAWLDFNETARLAVGTTTEFDVITDAGVFMQITPQTLVSDFTPDFDTTIASDEVSVNDPNILNVTTYDSVYFNTPVSVDGIILSGLYPIDLVLGATEYRIIAAANGVAGVTAGGVVPEFVSTAGSATIIVNFPAHGLSVGDTINFPIATTVSDAEVLGTYAAVTVSTVDQFTISVSTVAAANDTQSMNGGDAQLLYYIAQGPQVVGTGYGVGGYGDGGYGAGTTDGAQVGTPITATDWSFDNWGQILLANPKGGGIYQWQPNSGFQTAQLIAEAPGHVNSIFVAMPAQILVGLGCDSPQTIGVDFDPLRVQWSDQLDFNEWTPSATTQAGSLRIPNGSKIVGGFQGPQQGLIWTDLDLWALQYVGYPLVFGLNKIGSACGLIAQHAAIQMGSGIFWMGQSNFFVLTGGGATPIPCPVWDAVFQDLDADNKHKCWAWANSTFNEVWWFYPSDGATECDSYVKLNTVEGAWDYGSLPRTCGIDQSILGKPLAAGANSVVYLHEDGEDDDGQPLLWSFRTGFWELSDGNDMLFADWVIPDMRWGLYNGTQTATIALTFYSRDYTGGPEVIDGPYTVDATTEFVSIRSRGRQIALEVSGSDIGSFVRLGRLRVRFSPDGRY